MRHKKSILHYLILLVETGHGDFVVDVALFVVGEQRFVFAGRGSVLVPLQGERKVVKVHEQVQAHVEPCPPPHVLLIWWKRKQFFLKLLFLKMIANFIGFSPNMMLELQKYQKLRVGFLRIFFCQNHFLREHKDKETGGK